MYFETNVQNIFIFPLTSAVLPEFQLGDGDKFTLLAFKCLHLPLGIDSRHPNLLTHILTTDSASGFYFSIGKIKSD